MKTALDLAKEKIVFVDSDLAFSVFCRSYKVGHSLVVGVSGGADSVFALLVILSFVYRIGGSIDDVVVVHCNHQTRAETEQEEAFVSSFCQGLDIEIFQYDGDRFDENTLRKWRWECFREVCADHKTSMIVTGHHFSDRLETSLLHLYRGCALLGFSNMSMEDRHYQDSFLLRVFRPLLSTLKSDIEKQCNLLDVSYVVDPTNYDVRGGMRTIMRHLVLPQLLKNWDFLPVMRQFYASAEQYLVKLDRQFQLTQISISQYWDVEWGVKLEIDRTKLSVAVLVLVLQRLGVYHNVTQGLLVELCGFLHFGKQGYKEYGGLVFVLAHDIIYVFVGKAGFREKQIARTYKLDSVGEHSFGDFVVSVDEKLLGCQLRFVQLGDTYRGKRLKKYLLNKKVPFFWRNYILVAEREGSVEKVFDKEFFAQCQI